MTRHKKRPRPGGGLRFLLFLLILVGAVFLIREWAPQKPAQKLLEDYPQALVELYEKNPEARDFVLAWPGHENNSQVGEITAEELSGGLPLFLQWDTRWGYYPYGSSVLGVTGCGPTCLSIVAAGLTGDDAATPAAVSDFSTSQGYYVEGSGTSWELMTAGAGPFGLRGEVLPLSEELMAGALSAGRPLIVSLGPGDFTDSGHFIVLTGYEGGDFSILDPNSPARSKKSWSYERLSPQILNIWAFSPSS